MPYNLHEVLSKFGKNVGINLTASVIRTAVALCIGSFGDARLAQVLLRASKGGGSAERVEVLKLADFLNQCLSLDPTRRLSVCEALRHNFFLKKKKKVDTT